MQRTVGIVVPALAGGGGVPSVAAFLCETIEASEHFGYRLFSVPSSSRDPSSVRLASPRSWFNGPQLVEGIWGGRRYEHVGAVLTELECQRYRPRPLLTHLLRQCDLIQVVAGSPAWALVAKNVDRPVVLQVATLVSAERKEKFRREGGLLTVWRRVMTRVVSQMERNAVHLADRILVENAWMKQTMTGMTNSEKVVLAPPGVDTAYFHPPADADGGEKFNSDYILSVGRFDDPRKNIRLLFEAYARLVKQTKSVPDLVLAGLSGPREEDWELARKLGIRDRIRFQEGVSKGRLSELYRHASVFVLPSSEEGLGVVFLEAQASGVPVVATRTRGSESAVEHGVTGLLCRVDDPAGLADSLETLLTDKQRRRRMADAARKRAESHFSRETAGRRFLREYRYLVQ